MEDTSVSPNVPPALTYSLVLPPGWSKIPLLRGTDEAVREIARRAFSSAPSEVPRDEVAKYRAQTEGRLKALASKAAEGTGVDLFLATEMREDTAIPASFVVSEMRLPGGAAADAEVAIQAMSPSAEIEQITVGDKPGIRGEYVSPAAAHKRVEEATRHVDYILPAPGALNTFLNVSYSTPGDGDPHGEFADLLVELFDAIMGTFEWKTLGGYVAEAESEL